MKCPQCGSTRVSFDLRSAGTASTTNYYRTGVKRSWIVPSDRRKYRSTRYQKTMGVCQNCGYTWVAHDSSPQSIWFYIVCILLWPIALTVLVWSSRSLSHIRKRWKVLLTVLIWGALVCLIAFWPKQFTGTNSAASESTGLIWATSYTPIEDFEYYVDGDCIYLTDYTGSSDRINIAPSYTVNGQDLLVISLDGTFALDSVFSVIVPEGVTTLSNNVFNSCGIEYLYLPSTLTDFSGWNYFHDVNILYYGGTEEQWAALFTEDRASLEVVEVKCNSTITELLSSEGT